MKIAITGASGRMGRMLIEAVLAAPDMELAAALDRSDSPALGTDAGAFMGAKTGVTITDRTDAVLAGCQVLIDFTRPEASMAYLDACRQHGVKMVIGTTGFSPEERARIQQAAQDIAIVQAANMSPGVNAAIRLIELATQMLADTDIEVIEAHHRHKVDAPSGTALAIGEAIAAQLGKPCEQPIEMCGKQVFETLFPVQASTLAALPVNQSRRESFIYADGPVTSAVYLVTMANLPDDSIASQRIRIEFVRRGAGWVAASAGRQFKCREGELVRQQWTDRSCR